MENEIAILHENYDIKESIYKAPLWRKKSKEVPLKSGNAITKELDRPQILGLQKIHKYFRWPTCTM